VAAVAAVEVCVLDQALASGAAYPGFQLNQACATLFAEGVAGFGQGLTAVMTELGLCAHGLHSAE